MSQNSKNQSLNEMLSFLDWAAQKGIMKSATASAMKAASNKVLGGLDENTKKDLSKIDVEAAFKKFRKTDPNASGLNRDSLKTYLNRTKKAVEEFLAYKTDPDNWTPSIPQRARQSKNGNSRAVAGLAGGRQAGQTALPLHFPEDVALTYQFPLRPHQVIKILGLPRDLKTAEARRLAAFLMTLCDDYEAEG
ncbi:MAG: hypothetical protein ACE5I1_02400 [bacterium]